MRRHLVIPDTQLRPDDNFDFIEKLGHYLVEKQPDVVVCLGDWADMPSLSSYDVGKKAFEGRRYRNDVDAAKEGMNRLFAPIDAYNARQRRNGKKQYLPEYHLTLGNHENRINRAVNDDPKLEGVLSIADLDYEKRWKVYPFLDVLLLDGVAYSHYFVTGIAGRPASSARAQLLKTHQSAIAGHQQGLQIATGHKADGSLITNIIAGSFYEHDEDYMSSQGNKHWRGFLVLHEVQNGEFDLMPVSLNYLNKKYA